MAKKKTAEPSTQNGATTNPSENKPSKAQAVHAQLDKGIELPSQIVEILKGQGIEITTNYVSLIKGEYRKAKGGKAAKKSGRPAGKSAVAPQAVSAAARVTRSSSGLSPQDLADLAGLIERAGGATNLRAYLDVLEKLK